MAWGSPHTDVFRDQWTSEVFYRWQFLPQVQITPHVQLIVNPSGNPNDNVVGIFGVRGRVSF